MVTDKDIIRNINALNKKIENIKNNDNYDFYILAKQCHNDRLKDEYHKRNSLEYKTRIAYSLFYAWCRANDLKPTEENFKKYPNDLSFWMKKSIFETYFNYSFEYDYNKRKWLTNKL